MRTLHLAGHMNTGGITSYLTTLSAGLIRRGHEVICVAQGGDAKDRLVNQGVVCYERPLKLKSELHPQLWMNLPFLCELVNKHSIEIIHAHTRTTQVLGTVLSWLTKKPLVTTCHGFFKPRWHRRVFGCWGKGVIAISPMVTRHLTNDLHVVPTMIYEIVNGIDLQQFRPVDENARAKARAHFHIDQHRVIGLIARLSSVKGIDVLIKAMPLVVAAHPSTLLLIVGQGPQEEELKTLVNQLGLVDQVRFLPVIDQTSAILPVFDLIIAPSRMEGLGLSVMEAMACALPVIASDVGGLSNLITDGVDGYLTKPEDHQMLAKTINAVLSHHEAAVVVGRNARDKIIEHFTADQMVESTIKVYRKMVA